jgi:hypothetical protein
MMRLTSFNVEMSWYVVVLAYPEGHIASRLYYGGIKVHRIVNPQEELTGSEFPLKPCSWP